MDLQAILDAPSSDEDDDYLPRTTYSYGGGIANGSAADISLSATVSNLSNASSAKDRLGGGYGGGAGEAPPSQPQAREDYQQDLDALSGVSSSPGLPSRRKALDDVDGDILRELEGGNDDFVGQILRSYGASSHARKSGGSANLELEKILMEAGDDEDGHDTDSYEEEVRYKMSPARSARSKATARSTDMLLQSILNENGDDSDSDNDVMSPKKSGGHLTQRQSNFVESLSAMSLSGRSASNSSGDVRRLSSLTQPMPATGVPLTHSMEVDAILNSMQDDDDSDDLDMRSYLKQHSQRSGGLESLDADENDVRLNFHLGGAVGGQGPLRDVKYDDNISMQHPLSRKAGEDSLKDCTANFLQQVGTRGGSAHDGSSDQGPRSAVKGGDGIHPTSPSAEQSALSDLCLQHAEAFERRLLKPHTRNAVSPLTVKRRMKPKVELMTKARMTQTPSQAQHFPSQQSSLQSQQPRFGFSGGIIQSKSMSTLGAQLLKSSRGRGREDGLPTALAVNSKFIAVGNQKGAVKVFDLFEQLKIVLGPGSATENSAGGSSGVVDEFANLGSVTSIDLPLHGDYLLAGYGSGQIILFDILKGSVLKRIDDLHSSSISSARLTAMPVSGGSDAAHKIGAVSVDASGLVNKLVFSRGRLWSTYSVETECLLDGTAGQILAIDTLPPLDVAQTTGETDYHPSVHKIVLIALSSSRSSFAVSVEPKVSVLHRWARPPTERIDPTIGEDDRLTQVSSHYASTYVSSYAPSHVSSYVSTSTYLSNSTMEQKKKPSDTNAVPVPYLPCLSWGWALVSGGGNTVTPILARAWGCSLQFLRAIYPPRDEHDARDDDTVHWPAFGTHDEFDAAAPVVALNWLGKRSLVYLTLENEFTVIDTVIMVMQERIDFSGMKLVYAEFALSRSRQPDSSEKTTFMNSIRSNDNRLLVLCQDEVKEVTVLGMRQQIVSLEDGGQWLEALALALDHYESTIKSQEDNRRGAYVSKQDALDPSVLSEDEIWIAELLLRYLILAIDNAPEASPLDINFSGTKLSHRLNLAESHFEMLSGVCLEFCIVTRRLDLLFGPIFRCFYEARYINVFLDTMECYILNDRLRYIAPEAMALFVAHCRDMKDLSMVEKCLLHMDCSLMDYDSIISLLKSNALYTGLIHVYTNGLDDYVSPLEIISEVVFDAADTAEDMYADRRKDGVPTSKFEQYGYKTILYLQYCFGGKSFPKGNAIEPEERAQTLRPELFDLLFRELRSSPPLHQSKAFRGLRASTYPYLRALILIDPNALLDCLSIVLDDPVAKFAEPPGQMQALGSWDVEYETDAVVERFHSTHEEDDDPALLPNRQHLIDVLSSVIMSDGLVETSYQLGSRKQMTLLSIKAKHSFLDFLAKYLKLGVITAPKSLIGEGLIRLCNKKGASEDDVLALLHALPRSSYELDEAIYTVERAQMSRAALFLHKVGVTTSLDQEGTLEKCQHHYHRVMDCYVSDRDGEFRKGIFPYARRECSAINVPMLRNATLRRLPELVKLDAVQAAQLVGEVFVEQFDTILSSLKDVDAGRIEYSFLHAIISGELNKVDTVAAQELLANLTENHHHSYLLLMSRIQPDRVYQYLSTNRGYRLNDALQLCQELKITDASAYLLERMGDVSGALNLMLEALDAKMISLRTTVQQSDAAARPSRRRVIGAAGPKTIVPQDETTQKEVSYIKQLLSAVLDLCERNKTDHVTLDSANSERGPLLWFHVLDRLVNAKSLLRIPKDATGYTSVALSTVLSELLLLTMQRMISNVSLYDLMHKITKDHSGSDLGEFREMLVSMLQTYGSELDVCSSAVDVMYYDIRRMAHERKRLKVRGSYVRECPPPVSKNSLLDVGPAGSCEVAGLGIKDSWMSCRQDRPAAAGSLLQQRRRTGLHQARRLGKQHGRRGKNGINLMTASERRAPASFAGSRQVGVLSEAQNVGGL